MKKYSKRGGVIGVVVLSTVVVAVIAASVLSLINTQRKVNLSKELQLQANTIAEAALDYAFSYVANEVNYKTRSGASSIPTSGYKSLTLPSSATTFLSSQPAKPAGFSGITGTVTPTEVQIRVLPAGTTRRYRVDPNDPTFSNDRNKNKWVEETLVPIVARVTCESGGQKYTAHVTKPIAIREMPLFQFSILFAGQLQMHRGYRPLGDIHSNGPLLLNAHDGDNAIYTGFVSTYNQFTRGSTMNNDVGGLGGDAYGYTKMKLVDGRQYLDFGGGVVPKATGDFKIKLYTHNDDGVDKYDYIRNTTDHRMSGWKETATSKFLGHLEDASHQVPEFVPTGADGYRLDIGSTSTENEFTNGPYSLIEPLLPVGHVAYKSRQANRMNLEANASLIFRVEYDPNRATSLVDSSGVPIPLDANGLPTGGKTLSDAVNPMEVFRVKAYKYQSGWIPGSVANPTRVPVTLPKKILGAATSSIDTVDTSKFGVFEGYKVESGNLSNGYSTSFKVVEGLHDARLGRGVRPITLDVKELKRVMEANPASLTATDEVAFRDEFQIKHPDVASTGDDWTSRVIYFEVPTSLEIDTSQQNTKDGNPTYAFRYGSPETRHPDRASETDSRPVRSDKIVPIAPELRRYPTSYTDNDLKDIRWAIPALQIINATEIPNPYPDRPGTSIATNAPVYLIGSYNADGDYTTGTNITATAADAWATADSAVDETTSIIFSDSFTVLSESWRSGPRNREKSFFGSNNASTTTSNWGGRKVPLSGNNRLEIGACIATGEYPIFEFFFRALEDWQALYNTGVNPIIVKGAMAGVFHSEIQHIKQAYGRNVGNDIQTYWHAHGAFAIPTVRYHQYRIDGTEYPGEPKAYVPAQIGFRLLRRSDPDDAAILTAAGY